MLPSVTGEGLTRNIGTLSSSITGIKAELA
jgi:hypothetical protein